MSFLTNLLLATFSTIFLGFMFFLWNYSIEMIQVSALVMFWGVLIFTKLDDLQKDLKTTNEAKP